jgi:CubicO group peptidase (beta-lactamase class C family)
LLKIKKLSLKKGYRSANLEYDIPNSPSTIFHIASVSKQFTVFSILLLEKEGKLSFNDDVRKFIPEVPDFGRTITLRHLASHTSGMRDQWSLLTMAGWRADDVITKEHILKLVSQQKELNFKPGEAYTYCNTGFTLLAEVVARISGKTFAEFTEENIFKPLNMSNSLFYDDHEKIVKNRAYSYNAVGENKYKKSVLSYANVGATSLFTTVEDLALWSMNFSSHIAGNKDIFNKMNTLAVLNNGETFGGAYGQFVNKYKGLIQIQHGEADAGYRSYLGRFPDQKFSVMVFSNLGQSNPGNLALQVADLYLKDSFENESEATTTSKNAVEYINLTNEQLKKLSGHFWNDSGNYARKIYVKNDTLRYFRGEGNESALVPISPNEFKMIG